MWVARGISTFSEEFICILISLGQISKLDFGLCQILTLWHATVSCHLQLLLVDCSGCVYEKKRYKIVSCIFNCNSPGLDSIRWPGLFTSFKVRKFRKLISPYKD